jgi:uncharacterized protein YyaL (SSP411 family)
VSPVLLLALACAPAPVDPASSGSATLPGAPLRPPEIAARIEAVRALLPASYTPRTRHTSADGQPLFTNRLLLETSPYLRQHAHNPVDWYPWGEEAFAEALRRGVPILLSVGYSTCHWCHVMEEESFEDLEIARYLNENYVVIKVDREERPDVDAVYMTAVNAVTGRGGWPMTVWLTPDRKPFYAGTYFPARDGDRGARIGFLTLLQRMKQAYDAEPERVAETAAQIVARLATVLEPSARGEMPGAEVLDALASRHQTRYDASWGGVSGRPKFPSSLPIRFLLGEHERTGDETLLTMATHTLRQMAAGGIRDQLGGGFHRYSTDERWLVPHFEEMLYDNALLAITYTEAWRSTGDPAFARVVRDILGWVARDMTSPEGALYSATDADSPVPGTGQREEGWFFTWTADEIRAVLDEEHARAALAWYAVSPGGNFEGRSVLHTPRPEADVARELGLTVDDLAVQIEEARHSLLAARTQRSPPLRDEKILAAWNGLMISAYARAALALGEPDYARRAVRAADYVLGAMRSGGRLHRSSMDGIARHPAVLEDYAFLVAGLLDLFEATGELRLLEEAIALDREVQRHYEDPAGGWFRTPDDGESLLVRERPDSDGAEPSGASVMALSLYRLSELTTDDRYRQRADRALEAYAQPLRAGAMSELLLAVDWRLDQPKEIVIVTPNDRQEAEALLRVLGTDGPRNRVLVVTPAAGTEVMAKIVPLVAGKAPLDGSATAYVCQQGACALPTTDPEVFRRQLETVRVPR